MKTKSHQKIKFQALSEVPKTYRSLCALWLPRPIHGKEVASEATEIIDALSVFTDLNEDQLDYLDAVAHFVTEYEGLVELPPVSGLAVLQSLVEDHQMSGADLSRILGGSRMLGAMILRGERNITANHARVLGTHFNLSPGAFL